MPRKKQRKTRAEAGQLGGRKLIFDGFPNKATAEAFAHHVEVTFGRPAQVFDTQEDSNRVDPFLFELQPPIVLVERDDDLAREQAIECLVENFDGEYVGT